MESRVVRINPNKKQFPYFASGVWGVIWLVTGKAKRRGYVTVMRVDEGHDWASFEYNTELKQSMLTKIERMRLTFMIGKNTDA